MLVKDPELIRRLMESKQPPVSARALTKQVWGTKSHSYMNRILAGQVNSVSTDSAVKIAYLLGVPVDVIFVTRASGETPRSVQGKAS